MKNQFHLPIFLVLVALCPVRAQYFERNFQAGFYNQATELREGEEGDLLFTVTDQSLSLPTTFLYRVDSQGNTIHFPIFSEGQALDSDWLPLGDGYITTAYFFECDIIIPRHIARYDATGTLLWKRPLDMDGSVVQTPVKLLPGPDSTFWIFRAGRPPVQFNAAGDSIGVAGIVLPLFSGYAATADSLLLTYGPAGITLYDPGLNFLRLGFSGQPVLKARSLPDGRFAVLKQDRLILANSNFSTLQEVALPGPPIDMAVSDSGIWVLASTTPNRLLHYDLTLHLLESLPISPTAPFQPSFLAAAGQRLAMLGEEYRAGVSQVVGLRSTPAAAIDFDATPDAALLEITMPHLPVDHYSLSTGYHFIQFDSVAVTLKNEGPDTLRQVTINAVLGYDNFICQVEYPFRRSFTGLELAAGQSASLYIGPIIQGGAQFFSTQTSLCFWTTLPNDSLDHHAGNNTICGNFQVLVPAAEPGKVNPEPMRVFPNPAHTFCRVEWPDQSLQTARVSVINMAGQKVVETTVEANSWNFVRHGLPAGLYLVLVVREDGQRLAGKVYFD